MIEADVTPDEGEVEEYFDRVIAMAEDITDVFDDFDANTLEALSALSLVAGGVLTFEVPSKVAAYALLETMVESVKRGIDAAEESGAAWWMRNKAN